MSSAADTRNAFPLRVVRGTTGTVHAAREDMHEVLDFTRPADQRGTGTYRPVIVKACGFDPNTLRRVSSVAGTASEITCKKCLKSMAA
jgi:hypothetical protein